MKRYCVALLLAAAGTTNLSGQAPSSGPSQRSFTSTATAILVDVVVRDRKGRPVTDLAATDFEVAEDGVAQKIDTFTRVSHGGGIGVGIAWRTPPKPTAVPPADAPLTAAEEPADGDATTAIVFDHLSAESLRLAQKATLDYVPMNGDSNIRIGVFATDPGVRVLQSYTTDRGRVRRAVESASPSGTSAEEQKAERNDELVARRRDLQGQTESTSSSGVSLSGVALARTAAELGQRETELKLIQTELNMIRSFDNMDRAHQGYDTTLALLSVVQTLSQLPGRKTIVFFSEGLPVTPVLSARLDYVIDTANRANVTAYAVDAHGLRAKSTLTAARKEIDAFAEERRTQVATGSDRTEQPLAMAFERVEDTLRIDSRTGLARLAEETGGFLVDESNDLTTAYRRIDEDNQFHYLLTYSPRNTAFDGRFRAIRVKVSRPGTQVFARKGYRAIGSSRGVDPGNYELPATALLDHTPLPNAFPVHAAGFNFPDPARPGLTPLVVQVRTDALQFVVDRQRSTYAGQATVLVRIRDERGREVQKVSQQYLLAGDAKDVDAAKNGEILFYREIDLPAGVYTMESIVVDGTSRKGSARVSTLTVGAVPPSSVGMSSLLIVNRTEQVSDAPAAGQAIAPLYVGHTLVYPNLGQPIQKATASELPFYFVLYGDMSNVSASAQLLRNGQVLAEAPVQLPAASGSRVQHVGRLPIESLPAGTYELRIRVAGRERELSRTAFFTLQ